MEHERKILNMSEIKLSLKMRMYEITKMGMSYIFIRIRFEKLDS